MPLRLRFVEEVLGAPERQPMRSTRKTAILKTGLNAWFGLLWLVVLCPDLSAQCREQVCRDRENIVDSKTVVQASVAGKEGFSGIGHADDSGINEAGRGAFRKLIVIGFMGGKVKAGNLVHREAMLTKTLQLGYPLALHASIFANRDGDAALKTILQLLDRDNDGQLNDEEKRAARIVIFGHSWGASETVTLANRLNKLSIPVLLTIQVDSVQKQSQKDGKIPPNVHEAINFYQTEGLLRGRTSIVAMDPRKTTVLGNFVSSYRSNPVSCEGFPWYARAFMRPHIMIENDPVVWGKIEALILAKML